MNAIDQQPVPLGGCRVPESMGGSSNTPWQELPEQQQQQQELEENFGQACAAAVALREKVGNLKKQLSNLASPMKTYIYSSAPGSRKEIEAALSEAEAAAAAIGAAATTAAGLVAADDCLDAKVKAEAASVLKVVGEEAAQQAADSRALCLSTADKRDAQAASEEGDNNSQRAKELYGDFNLQLGPFTRKLFASQSRLLALIKAIKKQRTNNN
ncbi:hypothetical protein Esti_005778 [Eimeria stiedai]